MNKKLLRIAFIGNRALELEPGNHADMELFTKVCKRIRSLDHTMVSGMSHAGPDAISQRVFAEGVSEGFTTTDQMEIYVDNQKMIDDSILPLKELAIIMPEHLHQQRLNLLRQVMSADHLKNCSPYALGKHERNTHEVYGLDLQSPVDACITWCKMDASDNPVGGTATAYNLCRYSNIPLFNLWYADKHHTLNQIGEFLKG